MTLNILSGKVVAPRRIMMYGLQGIGKSTFGAMAPKPIFIQTEDGLGDIECDKFPLSLTYLSVMQNMESLYTEEHPYKTVVIDSLDWLEKLIWADVCKRRNVDNIESIEFQKGYLFAITQWREILAALTALRDEKGMSCILVAHSQIKRFDNPETESYDRYTPNLHKAAAAVIQEWCDEVLFATYKVYTKESGTGFKKTSKGIGGDDRVIRTTERPAHSAKNRLGLPDELPLDWNEYAKYLPEGGK